MVVFEIKSVAYFAAILLGTAEAVSLGAYNVDPDSVSVSGLSSGGFMAAQLGIAHSSTFKKGFGVFAGGPFDCARNQQYTMCMNNNKPNTQTPNSNLQAWSGNQIDDTANLKTRKVFLEVGTSDSTVGPNPMNTLKEQLASYVDPANMAYVTRQGQAHVFPTDFDVSGNNPCGSSTSPYIANCGYDGAGAVLNWMYSGLNPRSLSDQGSFVSFDQSGKYGAAGMASSGSLYVPKACQTGGTVCKLHVALHGCLQTTSAIGNKYTVNTGYNRWADTNNIIILYPQGTPDYTLRQAWQGLLPNPNGCWDWVGWYGNNADQKGGVQMAAIVAQVNRIVSGFQQGGGQPSTTTLAISTSTTTSSAPTSTVAEPMAPLYGQCGGIGWSGPTKCEKGVCTSYSPFYAQCLLPVRR
ncbi:fungal cellulose binding domain protein [Emericellopsis atlantica]|uniref:Fungal cellulose binding domain protein n=1 Tax=Emericellopsis atlantica TaxID=2614577 RepID=A0A9P7ZMY8_9HYPO|nr:fungal cellulose binding domain protein [Emericellopsis atlantica]KAG9255099.1 fungal cellulose binding domain protein [Emericellopsis atlantica]